MEEIYCSNCDEHFTREQLEEYRGDSIPDKELESDRFICDYCKDDIARTEQLEYNDFY